MSCDSRWSTRPRLRVFMERHGPEVKARCAASTAPRASSPDARGTCASVSPVAGSIRSKVDTRAAFYDLRLSRQKALKTEGRGQKAEGRGGAWRVPLPRAA